MSRVKELLSELYDARPACTNLSQPEFVAVHMLPYRDKKVEYFVAFFLDAKINLIARRVMSRGSVDTTAIYPREIIRYALLKQACSIIVSHNHPGGDPKPSVLDQRLTEKLQKACEVLDIRLLDHVVVARDGHFSFQAQGLL
ncbi:DNA repair protein radc [Desulfonatronum zhilinae]|nr:DNA repair protein radc [Desulfonatronum zhilinae]